MMIVKMRPISDAYGETVGYSIVFSEEERRKIEDAFEREELKAMQDLVLMVAQAGGIPSERLESAVKRAIADSISKAMS